MQVSGKSIEKLSCFAMDHKLPIDWDETLGVLVFRWSDFLKIESDYLKYKFKRFLKGWE